MSRRHELQQMIEKNRQGGWSVHLTNGGHWKWVHGRSGAFFFTGSTPSDHKVFRNIKSNIRRIERQA